MKKLLLSTSAIALAGAIAIPASAAEWSMKITGSMEQQFGFASSDNDNIKGDYDGVDVYSSSEIHFSPSIVLDNGIKFGARIELEGEGQSKARSTIDESYLYVSGSFGRIFIGSDDNAANTMAYAAPDVTFFNVNSGDDTAYLPFSSAFGTTTTYVQVGGSDPTTIGYTTPRLAGFQLAGTYSRDGTQFRTARTHSNVVLSDIFGVGANYTNSFGDVSIAVSGGYTTGSVKGESDPDAWAVGGVVGFGGFSIGYSFSDENNNGGDSGDMYVHDAGIAYETGPWGVSFNYVHGDKDKHDADIDKFLIGLNYSLATGVRLGAFGAYVTSDTNDESDGSSNGDGFVLGTGIVVSF